MLIGTRVLYPDEVGVWDADFLQITVYRGMKDNLAFMRECVNRSRDRGIPYVIHPVGYMLSREDGFADIYFMAEQADKALIVHDEKSPDGTRLYGQHAARFRSVCNELRMLTHLSFENASDTGDIRWFWDTFAESVTLDIGHVEAAGIDSVAFVRSLTKDTVSKIQYVHIHRNNGMHGGITDHWPLMPNCRELKALAELLKLKADIKVILELNETEMIGESIEILKDLRNELDI